MINKNELMFDEVKRYVELVNCSSGSVKQVYKDCVRDLMLAIAFKDWDLYDKCQAYINDNYIRG